MNCQLDSQKHISVCIMDLDADLSLWIIRRKILFMWYHQSICSHKTDNNFTNYLGTAIDLSWKPIHVDIPHKWHYVHHECHWEPDLVLIIYAGPCYIFIVYGNTSLISTRAVLFWHLGQNCLAHWGLNRMTTILQMTLSKSIGWMKIVVLLFELPWSLFLRE